MTRREYMVLIGTGATVVTLLVAILVAIWQGHEALRTEIREVDRALRMDMQEGFRAADAKTEALRMEMRESISELRREMQEGFRAADEKTEALRMEMRESIGEVRREMQDGFRAADAKTESLRMEMQGIRQDINELSGRVAALEGTIVGLHSDLGEPEEP